MVEKRGVCPVFDAADRLAIEADLFRESLLCEFLACAFGSDVAPDGLSSGGYPVGQVFGWHGSTLVGAVIIVCTIVGTFASGALLMVASGMRIKRSFE